MNLLPYSRIKNHGIRKKKMMHFPQIQSEFEAEMIDLFRFELLEQQYHPGDFGSGLVAYKINGRNVKLIYDGKDNLLTAYVSPKHLHYPHDQWHDIYTEQPMNFFKEGIIKTLEKISG
jgi:hypothetical protein